MANIKVSELPTATTFNSDDYTMIVQSSQSKKVAKANLLKKDASKARLGADYALTSSSLEKLPLSYFEAQLGTNLSINNSNVVIGDEINYIFITGQVHWYTPLTLNAKKTIKIYKNNDVVCQNIMYVTQEQVHQTIAGVLIPVQKNDTISVHIQGASGDVVRRYGADTYFTILAIN